MKHILTVSALIIGLVLGNLIHVLATNSKVDEYKADTDLKHTYYQHAIERQNEDLRMLINRMNAVEATQQHQQEALDTIDWATRYRY